MSLASKGFAIGLALAALSASSASALEFCALDDAALNVGFYAYFKPLSYSADEDRASAGFNMHRGYEADLLSALEALDGVEFSFTRRGIAGWTEPGVVPIWRLAAMPEYDIVGGGITILESRTLDDDGDAIVAFTSGHIAFRQSILVRKEDAERLAGYDDLVRSVRVGVLAGTTGEARLLQIVGLADAAGVLAAGTRVELPQGPPLVADGSDRFRITSAQTTANLEGRLRLHPPEQSMPTVAYLGYDEGESALLEALRAGTIDAVARGEIGNRDAAEAEGGRFVVTAVDAAAEHGGFVMDKGDTALRACLNHTISWLTNGRRIGYAEWQQDDQVFMERGRLWNAVNSELTLEAGAVWTRQLASLFPADEDAMLRFSARSDDPAQVRATIDDGVLSIAPDAYAEGVVGLTVTATDASGETATLRLMATVEPMPRQLLRGWRVALFQPPGWVLGVFKDAAQFKDRCANPRVGDLQGATPDENNWLRSWSNDTYLWYDEIPDRDPACCKTPKYFEMLKTSAETRSGRPRDRFHFTYDTEEWQALSQAGASAGYGARLVILRARPPREIRVAYTEPNTPATSPEVALLRGTRILEIDGVEVRYGTDTDTLNAGLRPKVGETHEFVVQDPGTSKVRTVFIRAAIVTSDPVQHVKVLETATGRVGYMLFNDHIATAETELIEAVEYFRSAVITDLVVDMRYNGGGWLRIANRLASMIAGRAGWGRTFERYIFNRKHPVINPVTNRPLAPYPFWPFSSTGAPLPTLELNRLFVLTGSGTCSASEAIINSLRGVDVEVVQIGDTTCGKPYGFYATDNCGTTYFTIQFKGVNHKGFGDFGDGFSPENLPRIGGVEVPGCAVLDDFEHQFGDPNEARLQAALQYRIDESCPTPSARYTETVAETPKLDTPDQAIRDPRPLGLKVLSNAN